MYRSHTGVTVIYAQTSRPHVRMNGAVPGLTNTPLPTTMARNFAGRDLDALRKVLQKWTPLEQMDTAWDVTDSALFLCPIEASYVTAAKLVVDGGFPVSTAAEGFVPAKSKIWERSVQLNEGHIIDFWHLFSKDPGEVKAKMARLIKQVSVGVC